METCVDKVDRQGFECVWIERTQKRFCDVDACFHATTGFLRGNGSSVLVSELHLGDTIMVLEESARVDRTNITEANVIGWVRRPSGCCMHG